MARLKRCEVCGKDSPASALFCKCGTSLALTPEREPEAQSVEARNPAPTVRQTPPRRELVFEWGNVEIRETLAIGRDHRFSPLAARIQHLDPKDFVSRKHAEVYVEDHRLWVRHLGENNPTYVDDRPLAAGDTAQLQDGTRLSFSTAILAVVRIS